MATERLEALGWRPGRWPQLEAFLAGCFGGQGGRFRLCGTGAAD
jgi:hypothetical protein